MKKLFALSAATLLSASAYAADPVTSATINVSGEVYAQTCTLDNLDANKKNNSNIFVVLDKITLSDLKAGQDNSKEFSVKFKDCDIKSTQSIALNFGSNHANVTQNGNLKNTNTTANASTGVQIKIMKEDGTRINLKNADEAKSASLRLRTLQNGVAEFKFKAGYIAEDANAATTGLVTSSIPVTLAYQ